MPPKVIEVVKDDVRPVATTRSYIKRKVKYGCPKNISFVDIICSKYVNIF